jgi:hypothetical protein
VIFVSFSAPRVKEWREWRKSCKIKLELLKAQAGPPYEIDDDLYKQCRDLIFAPYAGKCAYCEGKIFAQSAGQVEHFRPKSGLRNLKNKAVKIGPEEAHPGYWWLAYDPSNLLPACGMCNVYTRKAGGKGERFPLPDGGFVATKPGEEKREKPLLIHPGREDPAGLFDIDFETGVLVPNNTRAEVCIDVLGLNREALVEERFQAIKSATLHVRACRGKKTPPKEYQKNLDDHLKGRLPYSLAWRKVHERMTR